MTGGTIFSGARMAVCAATFIDPVTNKDMARAQPIAAGESRKGKNLKAGLSI